MLHGAWSAAYEIYRDAPQRASTSNSRVVVEAHRRRAGQSGAAGARPSHWLHPESRPADGHVLHAGLDAAQDDEPVFQGAAGEHGSRWQQRRWRGTHAHRQAGAGALPPGRATIVPGDAGRLEGAADIDARLVRTAPVVGPQSASGKWVARATRPCRSATRRPEERGGLLPKASVY